VAAAVFEGVEWQLLDVLGDLGTQLIDLLNDFFGGGGGGGGCGVELCDSSAAQLGDSVLSTLNSL